MKTRYLIIFLISFIIGGVFCVFYIEHLKYEQCKSLKNHKDREDCIKFYNLD